MRLGVITGSISRNAGGLYEAVRHPLQYFSKNKILTCEVFSLQDKYTKIDEKLWSPITTHSYTVWGPIAFGYSQGLLSGIKKFNSDLNHVHGIWMYPSLANYNHYKRSNKPYLISPHGMLEPWALKNSAWKKKLAGAFFENKHLKNARCLHALSEAEAMDFRGYGLKNPICVIPNGINLPNQPIRNISNNNLSVDKKTLLFLGRIHPKKGLLPLLEAWSKFQKSTPTAKYWRLSIAGWDQLQHEGQLKQFTEEHRLQNSISFLGPLFKSDKEAVLQLADAFILPSYSEGLPMSVLEAWGYRLPVIMTPECNLPEAFKINAAIKIETNSQSILAGLIRMAEMNTDELLAIGEKGRALVEQKYTWEYIAKEMLKVYTWSVGGGPAPGCLL